MYLEGSAQLDAQIQDAKARLKDKERKKDRRMSGKRRSRRGGNDCGRSGSVATTADGDASALAAIKTRQQEWRERKGIGGIL